MSPYAIWIVSPPGFVHAHAFDEVAVALHAAFRELGIAAPIVRDAAHVGATTIVLGGNLLSRVVVPTHVRLILFNLEQIAPDSPWMTEAYLDALRRFEVWDYSEQNIARLAALGVRARYCGLGYAPELSCIAAADPDIDVLFYGSLNERRLRVLRELVRAGLRVDARFGCYGAARDRLIARSRVVLNLHFYEARVLEVVRLIYLLANGKCVVSEPGDDSRVAARFDGGVAFARYADVVETCVHLVQRPAERHRIERTALAVASRDRQVDLLRQALGFDVRASMPPARRA